MKPASVSVALALALVCVASHAGAQDNRRLIAVEGSATVSAAPDRATLNMGVQARNIDLESARDQVAETVSRFLDFAADEGIDRSEIRTSGLSIRPEYRWNNDEQEQTLLGYFVQRDIVVELTDLDQLGTMMEGAVDLGINQVRPPAFGHSNEKELQRQALAAATEDARENALRIANTLGVDLGAVHRVSVLAGPPPPMPMVRAAAMAESFDGAAETYSAGQIAIEARVTAEFDVLAEDNQRR